jgi:hypothetical protein
MVRGAVIQASQAKDALAVVEAFGDTILAEGELVRETGHCDALKFGALLNPGEASHLTPTTEGRLHTSHPAPYGCRCPES